MCYGYESELISVSVKYRFSILILLISAVFFLVSMNIKWSGQNWKNIICSDAKCYYMYLPGIFIYNDLNFGFVHEIENVKYYDVNNYRDCRVYVNDKAVSKVTAGVALAQLPFFLAAHAYAKLSGYPPDGYSKPYQLGITLAAIFYLMAGLWFLHKLLNLYSISQKVQMVVIIACAFASNLFYYVLGEPGLSHVYSFALISAMIYFLKRYFISPNLKPLFAASLLLGVNVMIRPANILILAAIPFVAASFENLSRGIMMPLRRF